MQLMRSEARSDTNLPTPHADTPPPKKSIAEPPRLRRYSVFGENNKITQPTVRNQPSVALPLYGLQHLQYRREQEDKEVAVNLLLK